MIGAGPWPRPGYILGMRTKNFIDLLLKDCNGAKTRLELLQAVNTAQNELFSDNVLEMRELTTLRVEQEPRVPVFVDLAFVEKGAITNGVTYAVNDIVFLINGGYISFYRVVIPFTAATPFRTDVVNYCEPIEGQDYQALGFSTHALAAGVAVTIGEVVWDGATGFFYRVCEAATLTGTLATDMTAAKLCRISGATIPTDGTEPATGAAYPTYAVLDGLRMVTKIGTADSAGNFTTTYDCRIVQSKNPGSPVKVYVDEDLPLDTDLDVEGWRWPVQLTSENVDMEVPEVHQLGVLRTRVLMLVEEAAYGSSSYWVQKFKADKNDWYDYINRDKKRPPTERKLTYNRLAG